MPSSRRSRSSKSRPLEYAVSVHPGLEDVADQEIRETLGDARSIEQQRGWTVFCYPGDAGQALQLRTTEDVFVLLYRTDKLPTYRKAALPLLVRMANNSWFWDQAMTRFYQTRQPVKRVTYRVVAQMSGKHGFRRQEVRDAIMIGVQGRWPRWKPVAEDAHVEIWVVVVGEWAMIGIRLSDRKMRHRTYKDEHRPASLRPTLAAAMVALSKPTPEDRFCDPMCGAGTILAERALHSPYRELIGGDIDPDALLAAEVNLSNVHYAGDQVLHLWDAASLPIRTGTLDAIVCNLPFGLQIGSHAENERLYASFFREMVRVLRPGGRAVLLSSEKELMHDRIQAHPQLVRERELLIGVLGQAARIYVLRRYDAGRPEAH
ncbi:MAG: methyltransferase domain-containing protein [Anaerolineae bacterium]|jgi:tRNA (guanine6-N2)-methyltransferase